MGLKTSPIGGVRAAAITLALALALFTLSVGSALAAPSDPTMGLPELNTKLLASPTGSLQGYMKTVLKGSTIETIPLDVLAVAGDPSSQSSLILFEATGTKIDKIGGIAQGMSGSPIYVDDSGTDKLVGAVSYGDNFTIGGTGLATPIEAMMLIESDFSVLSARLARPVITSAGIVSSVIVAPNPDAFGGADAGGALVARPLSAVFIGGLSPSSAVYSKLQKSLAARGIGVVPIAAKLGTGTGPGEPGFQTPLVGGASVTAMEAWGDMWVGSLGTVTYASADDVLAFGHPLARAGSTSLAMTNAWIDGVWPSSMAPYKIGRPAALRGTFTQDRSAGALGKLGAVPAATIVSAHATDVDTGAEAHTSVSVPTSLLDQGRTRADIIGAAASMAAAGLFDQQSTPGSAEITATVVVSDGIDSYTITLPDLIDTTEDVPSVVSAKLEYTIQRLQAVLAYGVEPLHIESVDLESAISRDRRVARIVGVDTLNPVHEGVNTAVVSLRVFGIATTQTVNVDFVVPAGVPFSGSITAKCALESPSDLSYAWRLPEDPSDRPTISGVATELNRSAQLNQLTVLFAPAAVNVSDDSDASDADAAGSGSTAPVTFPVIQGSALEPWMLYGASRATAILMSARPADAVVPFGGGTTISGRIADATTPGSVWVYGTAAGGSERLLGKTLATMGDSGMLGYELDISDLYANTSIRAHFDSSPGWTGTDATTSVLVGADLRLHASPRAARAPKAIKLTANVWPAATAGDTVVFEYYNAKRHRWKRIGAKTLNAGDGVASANQRFKPAKGTWRVRATYLGGSTNARTTATSKVRIR